MDWFSDLSWQEFETKGIEKSDDGEIALFKGVASTGDIDLHGDIIEPGAFGEINAKRIPLLRDHDCSSVIGGWKEFSQDGKHLKVAGAISLSGDVPRGRETYTLMKQGFLSGISVGFRPKAGGVTYDENTGIRRIKKATLLEASIVSIPANQGARVRSIKSDGVLISREVTIEWLKGNGFDEHEIDIVMARGFNALIGEKRLPFTSIDVDMSGNDLAEVRGLLNQMERHSHV